MSYLETKWYQDFHARQTRRREREAQERDDMLNRRKKFTERQVDTQWVRVITAAGGFTTKLHPTTANGIPDRIAHFQMKTFYVELKATGEECSPIQIEMHRRLKEQGIEVYVLDTKIYNIWDLWTMCYTTYEGKHYSKNPHRKKSTL